MTENYFSHLRLEDKALHARGVTTFGAEASRFLRCDFSGARWKQCHWGDGPQQSVYIECNFDGASLQAPTPGNARFVRCTFRNANLKSWYCVAVEMIDCVFSGSLELVAFAGAVRPPYEGRVERQRNQFAGNDFSQASFRDVGFRYGIDLNTQRLPNSPDWLRVRNATAALAAAEGLVNTWEDLQQRGRAQGLLKTLADESQGGQEDLFLEIADLRKVFGAAVVERVLPALVPD